MNLLDWTNDTKNINHITNIINEHINLIDFNVVIPKTNKTVKDIVEIYIQKESIKNTNLAKILNISINYQSIDNSLEEHDNLNVHKKFKI